MVSQSSICNSLIPWDQVAVLIEYEASDDNLLCNSQQCFALKEHIVLQSTWDINDLSIDGYSDVAKCTNGCQYAIIASESVINNSELLKILEGRLVYVY